MALREGMNEPLSVFIRTMTSCKSIGAYGPMTVAPKIRRVSASAITLAKPSGSPIANPLATSLYSALPTNNGRPEASACLRFMPTVAIGGYEK
jgi:hypothetical protein